MPARRCFPLGQKCEALVLGPPRKFAIQQAGDVAAKRLETAQSVQAACWRCPCGRLGADLTLPGLSQKDPCCCLDSFPHSEGLDQSCNGSKEKKHKLIKNQKQSNMKHQQFYLDERYWLTTLKQPKSYLSGYTFSKKY